MMKTDTYKTGETPQVGDTVRLNDSTGIDYYSTLKSKNTVVTGVSQGTQSTLISVKDGASLYKVSRFNLVNRMKGEVAVDKSPIRFRIVSTAGQLITNASTPEHLQTQLQKLLLENPGKSFDVYQYLSTAAAKLPEVQFVDRRATVSEDPPASLVAASPQKNYEPVAKMFTKR